MIKSIHAKNLFSWSTLDFEIPNGLSQISGFNWDDNTLEGVGKSSVFHVATWTLYGKLPKEVLLEECIKEGEKNAEGIVVLYNNSKIIRRKGKDHGLFLIDPSGTQHKTSNEEVAGLIMSFEMFCQTVYFAQNYNKKFIQADEETKAKILTEARDIKVYDFARKLAEDAMKEVQDVLVADRVYLKDYQEQLTHKTKDKNWIEQQIEDFDNRKQEVIEKIVAQVESLKSKTTKKDTGSFESSITLYKTELEEVQKQLLELTAVMKTIELVKESNRKLQNDLINLEKRKIKVLDELVQAKGDNCPTCGQHASKSLLKAHITAKEEECNSILFQIKEKTAEHKEMPDEPEEYKLALIKERSLKNSIKAVEDELSKIKLHNAAANSYIEQVTLLKEQRKIEKAKNADELLLKQTEILSDYKRLTDRVESKLAEVEKNDKKVRQYDELRKSFKQIKSDIFQTALSELTRNTNTYLRDLFDNPVKIRFENVLERKVVKIKTFVTINGKERSLGLYSGGQFRRIAIAVDLALSKMVSNRSSKPFNIRFLDEPCKDLSAHSKEKFMELVRKLPGNTVLIEHDKEIGASIDQTFFIDFKNETSVRRVNE